MSRVRLRPALSALVAMGLVGAGVMGACAEKKGAIMLAISTDMKAPKDVNAVSVTISTNGTIKHSFIGRVTPQGEVLLPATLAITEPEDKNASIRIRVMAFQDRKPRVLRDVRTTIPTDGRTGLLRIPLNFINDGSTKSPPLPLGILPDPAPGTGGMPSSGGDGAATGAADFDFFAAFQPDCPDVENQTWIDGVCQDSRIDASSLPEFEPEALGDSTDTGSCFEVAKCFANARVVADGTLDRGKCVFPISGADPARLNLAIATSDTGECVRPGECYIPIDRGAAGWHDESGNVALPAFVCELIDRKKLRLVESDATCAAKTEANPICATKLGDPMPELDAGLVDAAKEAATPDAEVVDDSGHDASDGSENKLCVPGADRCVKGAREKCDPTGQAWGPNPCGNSQVCAGSSGACVNAVVSIGGPAYGIAISPDGSRAYVAAGSAIKVIDTASATIIDTMTTLAGAGDVIVSPDGKTLFVGYGYGNGSYEVTRIDVATGAQSGHCAVSTTWGSSPVARSPDGKKLYAGLYPYGDITQIDVATFATGMTYPADTYDAFITVSPAGNQLWVGNHSGFVSAKLRVIDVATGGVTPLPLPDAVTVFSPDATRAYVRWQDLAAGGAVSVSEVTAATLAIASTTPLGITAQGSMALNADGTRLVITNADTNSVMIMNAQTKAILNTIPTPSPYTVAVAGSGVAYVGSQSGSVTLVPVP